MDFDEALLPEASWVGKLAEGDTRWTVSEMCYPDGKRGVEECTDSF